MKSAVIVHGMPGREEYFAVDGYRASKSQWIPWVKEQLSSRGIITETPEMPVPYEPEYKSWCSVFEKLEINENTILIGHSCGGGFILRWLSENKVKVGQVVLVAPWIDPDKELNTGMFDFKIDPELISRTTELIVMYSLDDEEDILKTVNEIKVVLPQAVLKEFSDKGHFVFEHMGTNEFPELLDVIFKN